MSIDIFEMHPILQDFFLYIKYFSYKKMSLFIFKLIIHPL